MDQPAPPQAPPPRGRLDRLADLAVGVCTVLMLIGFIDALEGMLLIAGAGLVALAVAFRRGDRARWLILAGLAVVALTFGLMIPADALLPRDLVPWLLLPWIGGGLLILAGDVLLLRAVLSARPRLAKALTLLIVLVVALQLTVIAVLLSRYWAG